MSKKHFEAFAQYIREYSEQCPGVTKEKQAMAQMICKIAARDNPRFDCRRFLVACGLEEK